MALPRNYNTLLPHLTQNGFQVPANGTLHDLPPQHQAAISRQLGGMRLAGGYSGGYYGGYEGGVCLYM